MKLLSLPRVSLAQLGSALEASWDRRTAYLGAFQPGNPALGQCYPTARVVQWFFPRFEIASGEVDTGSAVEAHFWNMAGGPEPERVDFTWQQFPRGSHVVRCTILDRHQLGDSAPTVLRCQLLLQRVCQRLGCSGAAAPGD